MSAREKWQTRNNLKQDTYVKTLRTAWATYRMPALFARKPQHSPAMRAGAESVSTYKLYTINSKVEPRLYFLSEFNKHSVFSASFVHMLGQHTKYHPAVYGYYEKIKRINDPSPYGQNRKQQRNNNKD